MSVKMRCPCGQDLLAPDYAIDQKVQCPTCGLFLLVPDVRPGDLRGKKAPAPAGSRSEAVAAGAPARSGSALMGDDFDFEPVDDEPDEGDRRRRGRRDDDFDDDDFDDDDRGGRKKSRDSGAYAVVAIGLLLLLIMHLVLIGVSALSIPMGLLLYLAPTVVFVFQMLLAVAVLLALLGGLTGAIMCCWAPAKSGAAKHMITALIIGVAGPVVAFLLQLVITMIIANVFVESFRRGGGIFAFDSMNWALVILIVSMLVLYFSVAIAAQYFYFKYMSTLASHLRKHRLAAVADWLFQMMLFLLGGYFVGVILVLSLTMIHPMVGGITAAICSLTMIGAGIFMEIRHIYLLKELREVVARRA